jgi:hypothetical protein
VEKWSANCEFLAKSEPLAEVDIRDAKKNLLVRAAGQIFIGEVEQEPSSPGP